MSETESLSSSEVLIGAILVVILLIPIGLVIAGLCMKLVWGWFIVPVFELPPLTIYQGIGLSLFVAQFRKPPESGDGAASQLVTTFAYYFFLIAISFIVYQIGF